MAIVLAICSTWYVGKMRPGSEHADLDLEAIDDGHLTAGPH
jgi:hypothetical protein